MLDYETLKLIWWLLVGGLPLGFAVMDGHDLGVGTLVYRDFKRAWLLPSLRAFHWAKRAFEQHCLRIFRD